MHKPSFLLRIYLNALQNAASNALTAFSSRIDGAVLPRDVDFPLQEGNSYE